MLHEARDEALIDTWTLVDADWRLVANKQNGTLCLPGDSFLTTGRVTKPPDASAKPLAALQAEASDSPTNGRVTAASS